MPASTSRDGTTTTLFARPEAGWPAGAVARFLENVERVRMALPVYEAGENADGSLWLRQSSSGQVLRERLAGTFAAVDALRILGSVCRTLIEVHGRGGLHLGLDADSVFIDGERVQVVDFGVDLLVGRGRAPEQLAHAPVDARTDVFAVGKLAAEMFARVQPEELARQIRALVARATAEAPADRHPSVEALLRELPLASGLDATVAQGSAPAEGVQPEGTVVADKYRIVRHIGSGGMGHVYEAEHRILSGKRVALKSLRAELRKRPGMEQRFLQEARVAAELRHPHIVVVEDVEMDARLGPVMVMELLRGTTIERRLRVGRLPAAECVALAVQALEALELAHSRGVVHRDIKPANLFIVDNRSVKLLDFGIAQNGEPTVDSHFEGTPRYASPEQLALLGPVGQQSDVYSLGITLFEMLTGEYPARDQPLDESLAAAGVDAATAQVVARACEKDRARRFGSARELRQAL